MSAFVLDVNFDVTGDSLFITLILSTIRTLNSHNYQMFALVEELWKAQQFGIFECCFHVPLTFMIQGRVINCYFSSQRCPGKILRKRKEKISLQTILDSFADCKPHAAVFQRRLDANNVHIKYLTQSELERLIRDMASFPDLYHEVSLTQSFPSEDLISYSRVNKVTQIQHRIPLIDRPLVSLEDNSYATEKIMFEQRVTKVSQCIEKMVGVVEGSFLTEIVILYKYLDNKLIALYNPKVKFAQKSMGLAFQLTNHYLFNQAIYDQYLVQEKQKVHILQCNGCRQLVDSNDTSEVLANSLWQIRLKRNVFKIANQKVNMERTGLIRPLKDQFKFVKVCQACYSAFLQTVNQKAVTQEKGKKSEIHRLSGTQKYENNFMSSTLNERKVSVSIERCKRSCFIEKKPRRLENSYELDEFDIILERALKQRTIQMHDMDSTGIQRQSLNKSSYKRSRAHSAYQVQQRNNNNFDL